MNGWFWQKLHFTCRCGNDQKWVDSGHKASCSRTSANADQLAKSCRSATDPFADVINRPKLSLCTKDWYWQWCWRRSSGAGLDGRSASSPRSMPASMREADGRKAALTALGHALARTDTGQTNADAIRVAIVPLADIATCWHPKEDDESCTPKTRSPAPAGLLFR